MSSVQFWMILTTIFFFVKAAVSMVIAVEKDRVFCAFAACGWLAWAIWGVSLNS